MEPKDIKDIKLNFKSSPKQVKFFLLSFILILALSLSFYTVDANENAVILRLGKYYTTTNPGLQFKVPFLDQVYKVKVDYQYKKEFGFRTVKSDKKSQFRTRRLEDESWMLTGDLKIAEVKWVVQYKINNAKDYLFNVKNVENTIRDASEASMQQAPSSFCKQPSSHSAPNPCQLPPPLRH